MIDNMNINVCLALQEIGMNRLIAETISILDTEESKTMHDIELTTGFRQPVVSKIMAYLHKEAYVECEIIAKESKGRPQQAYKLRKTHKQILKEGLEKMERDHKEKKKRISLLIESGK